MLLAVFFLVVDGGFRRLVVHKFCLVAMSTELFPEWQQLQEHAPLQSSHVHSQCNKYVQNTDVQRK